MWEFSGEGPPANDDGRQMWNVQLEGLRMYFYHSPHWDNRAWGSSRSLCLIDWCYTKIWDLPRSRLAAFGNGKVIHGGADAENPLLDILLGHDG